jgi:hypothetical protein
MPNYQNGKIYKIWNNDYTKCYIGSTIIQLTQLMAKHRYEYKLWLKNGLHKKWYMICLMRLALKIVIVELVEHLSMQFKRTA